MGSIPMRSNQVSFSFVLGFVFAFLLNKTFFFLSSFRVSVKKLDYIGAAGYPACRINQKYLILIKIYDIIFI